MWQSACQRAARARRIPYSVGRHPPPWPEAISLFVQVWRYRVRPDSIERFIERYGPDGTWARLFGRASGYRGTLLLRDSSEDRVFLTVDSWESRTHLEAFLESFGRDYRLLDEECEELTESEEHIGSYDAAGTAPTKPL